MQKRKTNDLATFLFSRDNDLNEYIARHNAQMGVYVGWGIVAIELVFIVGALVRMSVSFNPSKFVAYVVLGCMSVVLAILARRRLKRVGYVHAFMGYLIVYLFVAAVYGINNSLQDFADGKQIITFYMIMMMNTCIFVAPPIGTLNLVVVSYVAMFLLGFSGGRMDPGSLVNFWVSGVIVAAASLLRYNDCRLGAKSERRLHEMGSHDGLTGLRNRMALRDDFDSLVGRDQYVIMADLDDFKKVNDTYGHDAGDTVLVAYARALERYFPSASCYRYGGDEYLLFVPDYPHEEFVRAARQLKEEFNTVELETGAKVKVSASLGYAKGEAGTAAELRELVRKADSYLYQTKQRRRVGRTGSPELEGLDELGSDAPASADARRAH